MKPRQVELREANEFVARLHRHHKPVRGHRFSLGVEKDGQLVGVAIVGRPVARGCPPNEVIEVTRCCTDGTRNACSFLYARAARIARDLGYRRIQTYVLESEHASSLKAAGWRLDGTTRGGEWRHTAGPRRTDQPTCPKQRWVVDFYTPADAEEPEARDQG